MGGETKCDICGRTREEAAFLFAKMAHEAVHIPKCHRRIKIPQLWRLGIPQDRRFKIPHPHLLGSGGFCSTMRGGE